RLTALAGAQLLVYPTAIGWETGARPEWEAAEHDAWETAQRAHAIANGVFVIAVNRVGQEERLTFWGQSFVADPFGRVVARASAGEAETLVVDCDLSLIEEVRRGWPFLRDRRVGAYGDLARRFRDWGIARSAGGGAARRPGAWATAGPPSGSPTARRGSPGLTIPRPGRRACTRWSRASRRSCARSSHTSRCASASVTRPSRRG